MRKQVRMSNSLDDEITITFHDDNSVTVEHSNIHYGKSKKHECDGIFETGKAFFLQYIGALYLDGYR